MKKLLLIWLFATTSLFAQPKLIGTIPENSDNFLSYKGDLYFTGNEFLWKWDGNSVVQIAQIPGQVEEITATDSYIYCPRRKTVKKAL